MTRPVVLLAAALLAVLTGPALAVERKALKEVDLGAFSQDSQAQAGGDQEVSVFWWIPVEFWEASVAKQGGGNEKDGSMVDALRPYILVGVVRAKISPLGGFRFASREQVKDGLRVRYEKPGAQPLPLVAVDEVDPDVNIVLGTIRPILANAIGPMGQSMHFFTLTDSVERAVTPISPYEPGVLRFTLGAAGELAATEGAVETPMNSLFVPRLCPNGKPAHVSWKVCPWDGTALKP